MGTGQGFLWGKGSVLELIVVMVAHTVNVLKLHFKWLTCMVCELYLGKAVI